MKSKGFFSILALVCLFFSSGKVFGDALDNWHWRNPLPNGNPQAGPHILYGVVFANGIFFGVGDSGVVSVSSDTTNWTEYATATANQLNGIAYVNGLFLAVGAGGAVETSIDGTNWVLRASGTTNSLSAIAYGNGRYVVVGNNVIIVSQNGTNWSSSVSGISGAIGVTYGSAGFLAIGGVGGSDQIYLSSDGVTWTSKTLSAGTGLYGEPTVHNIVTFANGSYLIGSYLYLGYITAELYIFNSVDGSTWSTNAFGIDTVGSSGLGYNFFVVGNGIVLAAGSENGINFLQFSANGINWTSTNNLPVSNDEQGYSGAFGNGTYVIVAPPVAIFAPGEIFLPQIFTSFDGLTWTNRQHLPFPPTGPAYNFTSIAFSNGVYVVGSSNSIVLSTNGLVYTIASNTPFLSSVAYFGSNFIGVGSGGNIYQSSNGLSWTQRNSGTASSLHGITSGNGLLVAVGDNGAIQTSSTGTIWTSRTSGTSLPLYGVAYSNGLFVAVGQLGTVLTSPDAISWTGQDSGQLTNLLSVTFGSAGLAAVGPGGTILTSADGINWTTQNSGTLASLESITFGNGYYLATGNGAVVLTSPDGITWTSRNIGATGGQNLYGSAFLNSRFDVVGSGGTIIESDVIAPLFDVQIHRGGNWLTAFAPPGSNFRIQTSTNLAAPIWTDAASFNNASAITQWTNTVPVFNQLFYRAISP